MSDKNYATMKGYLLGKPRLVDSEGTYEVIGRVTFPRGCKQIPGLAEKIGEKNPHIYSYEFGGEEVLASIDYVNEIIKNQIGAKSCVIFTPAQCNYWNEAKLKNFDKVIVERLSRNDAHNSVLLGVTAIDSRVYQEMDEEFRKKIIFFVDYEKACFKSDDEKVSVRNLFNFINWAKKLGIREVIFLEREEGLRVFPIALNALVLRNWHLKAAKATEENEKKYVLMVVEKGRMKISFKTRVDENNDLWKLARIHRFVYMFNN